MYETHFSHNCAFFAGTNGLFNHPNGIGFQMALAYAVAQTIVTLIFFVLTVLLPVAGQIIIMLIRKLYWGYDGLYIVIGKKTDTGWKIHQDIWNFNA